MRVIPWITRSTPSSPKPVSLGTGKKTAVLENGGIGKRRYWKTAVLENGGIGKRRYWKTAVLENGGIGKRRYWKTAVLENGGIGKRRLRESYTTMKKHIWDLKMGSGTGVGGLTHILP